MHNSPLSITKAAAIQLETKKISLNHPKSHILNIKLAPYYETEMAHFDFTYKDIKDIKNIVYDDDYAHTMDSETAMYLLGSTLDYKDNRLIFDHMELDGLNNFNNIDNNSN